MQNITLDNTHNVMICQVAYMDYEDFFDVRVLQASRAHFIPKRKGDSQQIIIDIIA